LLLHVLLLRLLLSISTPQADARKHQNWMLSSAAQNSWWSWNKDQRSKQRNDNKKQMHHFWKGVMFTVYNLVPMVLLVMAIVSRLRVDELPEEYIPDPLEEPLEDLPNATWYPILLGEGLEA
jgi:hypothetical protein